MCVHVGAFARERKEEQQQWEMHKTPSTCSIKLDPHWAKALIEIGQLPSIKKADILDKNMLP